MISIAMFFVCLIGAVVVYGISSLVTAIRAERAFGEKPIFADSASRKWIQNSLDFPDGLPQYNIKGENHFANVQDSLMLLSLETIEEVQEVEQYIALHKRVRYEKEEI